MEYDLTNRPTSRAHIAGKFIYLRDEHGGEWSLGHSPMTRDDAQTSLERTSPSVRLELPLPGHRSQCRRDRPCGNWNAEICRIRITNTGATLRRIDQVSYREIFA